MEGLQQELEECRSNEGFVMNIQPSEAEAGFDIRVSPDTDVESLEKRIAEEWAPVSSNMIFQFPPFGHKPQEPNPMGHLEISQNQHSVLWVNAAVDSTITEEGEVFSCSLCHGDGIVLAEFMQDDSIMDEGLIAATYMQHDSIMDEESDVLPSNLPKIDYDHDVVMVVPVKREEASMWAFLQPFTPGMWCTTTAIMIYTTLVVYLLEQKINPLAYRESSIMEVLIHICIYRSEVSAMPLSQRLRVESHSARCVIAVWLLVMYLIVSSYISIFNLTLSAQQIKPTITSVNELLASDVVVGYRKHAFTKNYLHLHFGIAKFFLKPYTTPEEYEKALSKGPNKGGVAAVFEKSFVAFDFVSGRRGYTMISLVYSPPEVGIGTPNPLGVKNFLVFFIITGTVSTLALIIFFFNLLYGLGTDPNGIGQRTDTSLADPPNEEEQSSIGGDNAQTMGITNISDTEENTLIESTLVCIPQIADESQSLHEHDV